MASNVTPYVNTLTNLFVWQVIQQRDPEKSLSKNYLYPSLFPVESVAEDTVTWEIMREQNPLAGVFSQEGRPLPAGDITHEQAFASVARIMAGRVLNEQAVKELRGMADLAPLDVTPGTATLQAVRARHEAKIARDILACDNQIEAQLEYLATQAMQGEIVWPPVDETGTPILARPEPYWGRAKLNITLPFASGYKSTYATLTGGGGIAWNSSTAKIVQDLDAIRNIILETTGEDAVSLTMIMSNTDFRMLAKNTELLGLMRGNGTLPTNIVTRNDVLKVLSEMLDITVRIYDQKWTYVATNSMTAPAVIQKVRFLRLGRTIIYPSSLGRMGITATSPAKGPDSAWRPGKFTWFHDNDVPPFTTEVGVGMNAFPLMQRMDQVFVFDMY